MKQLIDTLANMQNLDADAFTALLDGRTPELDAYLFEKARAVRHRYYDRDVYIRGIIEFSSYCKNDCYYCGIRRSNRAAQRYRLTEEEILSCCESGYALGYRTFVLQGGEDPAFTRKRITALVYAIKNRFPDCALTLSIGEHSRESYLEWFRAGADRYLLRHETASPVHYARLHPPELTLENRKRCLWYLKEIGYQVGAGFMVGSPGQTTQDLVEDLQFLHELSPHMVGIGPFIAHKDTPFAGMPNGSVELTVFLVALLRLMLPDALLPATTALGTLDPMGREKGVLAGANVVMPNLSPREVREKYMLYDNKICTGDEAAECRRCMAARMQRIGYETVVSRGDCKSVAFC